MRDRYEEASRLLGAKYRAGIPAVTPASVKGRSGPVSYGLTWDWKTESRRVGLLGRKKVQERLRRHLFRMEHAWIDQPMTLDYKGGDVICNPAVPGELSRVTVEQIVKLIDAYKAWPGLLVTNHGFTWGAVDNGVTGQELAVTIQAMCASLEALAPAEAKADEQRRLFNPFRREQAGEPGDQESQG